MKSIKEREQQAVTIATGLAVFVGMLVVGALVLLVGDVIGFLQRSDGAALWVSVLAAGACALYLARRRRP